MNIQQRIKLIRGTVKFESKPGHGMKVIVELPIEDSINSTQTGTSNIVKN